MHRQVDRGFKKQVYPDPKQRWGGDLCTTPTKVRLGVSREVTTICGQLDEQVAEKPKSAKLQAADSLRTTGSEEPTASYGEK